MAFSNKPVVIHTLRWLLFSVVFAMIPFISAFFHLVFKGTTGSLPELVSHGELFIVSAALAADALGDLIASGKEGAMFKLMAGGACLLLLSLASLFFADVSINPSSSKPDIVYTVSLWVFVATLVSSGSCKVLAEP